MGRTGRTSPAPAAQRTARRRQAFHAPAAAASRAKSPTSRGARPSTCRTPSETCSFHPVERAADEAPLTVMLMARGSAWITPDGDGVPVRLGPGDLAITRGPDPYTCGDECRYPDGTSLNGSMDLGVRTRATAPTPARSC